MSLNVAFTDISPRPSDPLVRASAAGITPFG